MIRALVCILLCVAIAILPTGCKKSAEKATEKIVKAAKDTGSGIKEGLDKGRKATSGPDGALIISTHYELAKYAKLTVLCGKSYNDGRQTAVEIAVDNFSPTPLRLTDIHATGAFSLVDKDGFSVALNTVNTDSEVTILPKAKQKWTLYFDGPAATASKVLVYGNEYVIPAIAAATQTAPAN